MRVPYIFKSGKEVKLFDNQIMEWLFKNDIRTSQMVLIPLSFVYFCLSIRQLLLEEEAMGFDAIDVVAHSLKFLFYFLIGVVFWTALEYKTHRFDLHDHDSIKDFMTWDKIETHHLHHMFTNQELIIAIPLWKYLYIAVAIISTGITLVGTFQTMAFSTGVTLTLVFYDTMHFWFHFGGDFKFKPFQALKEKHMKHHYRDHNRDFGVSTSFWDYVFDTA